MFPRFSVGWPQPALSLQVPQASPHDTFMYQKPKLHSAAHPHSPISACCASEQSNVGPKTASADMNVLLSCSGCISLVLGGSSWLPGVAATTPAQSDGFRRRFQLKTKSRPLILADTLLRTALWQSSDAWRPTCEVFSTDSVTPTRLWKQPPFHQHLNADGLFLPADLSCLLVCGHIYLYVRVHVDTRTSVLMYSMFSRASLLLHVISPLYF